MEKKELVIIRYTSVEKLSPLRNPFVQIREQSLDWSIGNNKVEKNIIGKATSRGNRVEGAVTR